MGLDMYLTRRVYVRKWDHEPPERTYEVTVTKGGKPTEEWDPEKAYEVVELVMDWRKANHIHAWFVEHVQGGEDECRPHYVELEQLKQLRDLCKQAVAERDKAPALLPTQSGFFFGGTEYDEWYFNDTAETAKVLTEVIEREERLRKQEGYWGAEFSYRSSW